MKIGKRLKEVGRNAGRMGSLEAFKKDLGLILPESFPFSYPLNFSSSHLLSSVLCPLNL
jgi:hypothetical protein